MRTTSILFAITAVLAVCLVLPGCQSTEQPHAKQLTLAVNSGVEGEALKQAALDYEKQTGIHISIADFPYANLFEKELIDLNSSTGAYDLIMVSAIRFQRVSDRVDSTFPKARAKWARR